MATSAERAPSWRFEIPTYQHINYYLHNAGVCRNNRQMKKLFRNLRLKYLVIFMFSHMTDGNISWRVHPDSEIQYFDDICFCNSQLLTDKNITQAATLREKDNRVIPDPPSKILNYPMYHLFNTGSEGGRWFRLVKSLILAPVNLSRCLAPVL